MYPYYHHAYGFGLGIHPLEFLIVIVVAIWLLSIIGFAGIFAALALLSLLGGNLGGAVIFGLIAYLLHDRRRRW